MNQSIEKRRIDHLESIKSIDELRKSVNYSVVHRADHTVSGFKDIDFSNIMATQSNTREVSFDQTNNKISKYRNNHNII